MSEVVCKAGDWIVYQRSDWGGPAYLTAQVVKITPKQIRVEKTYDRIIKPISVIAALNEKDAADKMKQALDGAVGEYNRRRRKAEDIKSEAITQARQALAKSVDEIVSRALGTPASEGEE